MIDEHACIAFSDVDGLFDDEGNLRSIKDIPESLRRAVSSVKVTKRDGRGDDLVELKLWSKTASLDGLQKILGMNIQRHELSGDVSLVVESGVPEPEPDDES